MALTFHPDDITRFVESTTPHDYGQHRLIWLMEDVIVKKNKENSYNQKEFSNYQRVMAECGEFLDKELVGMWCNATLRIPEMTMCGEYLIAQRIDGEELSCEKHENVRQWCLVRMTLDACGHCKVMSDVHRLSSHYLALHDIHEQNFFWDEKTRTAWVFDLEM